MTTSSNLEIIITLNFEVICLKTAYLTLANSFFWYTSISATYCLLAFVDNDSYFINFGFINHFQLVERG